MRKYIFPLLLVTTFLFAQEGFTVDDLTNIGLEKNHGLKLLREGLVSAKLSKADYFTDYLPNLSLTSNYTRYTSSELPLLSDREDQTSSVSANMTWTLFSGGMKYLSYRNVTNSLNEARITLTDSERETAYQIKAACYNLIYAKLSKETAEKNLESSLNEYELISEKNELGLASRVDLLKMEVDLANAKLSVLRSKNDVKSAYRTLNQIVDFPLDSVYEIIDEPLKIVEEPEELENYLERAENSTQMKEIDANYKSTIFTANQAFSSFLPTLTSTASYSWNDERMTDDFDRYGDEGISTISLDASWYIVQGGKRLVSLGQALSSKRSAEITKQMNIKNFYNNVQDTYETILESKSSYELAQAQFESAEVGLELVEEQFRLGNATVLELLDARVAYMESHNNLTNALQTYRTQIAKMEWLCPPMEDSN